MRIEKVRVSVLKMFSTEIQDTFSKESACHEKENVASVY